MLFLLSSGGVGFACSSEARRALLLRLPEGIHHPLLTTPLTRAATRNMCIAAHLPSESAPYPTRRESSSRAWDSLITESFRFGKPLRALSLYHQMQQHDSVHPSPFTLVCLLKACSQLKECPAGRILHAHIARMSLLDTDPFLGSAVIDMYAKCGSLPQAQQVFDKLSIRNVVVWTALIAGYVDHGYCDLAIFHLENMQRNGVCPDDVTFICVLKACSNIGALEKGQELHAEATMKGLDTSLLLCSTLVDMYAKCGCLSSAQVVYDKLPVPSEVAYTSLIVGYVEHGLANEALRCFKQMPSGLHADAVTYVCCLKACGNIGAIKDGCKLHAQVTKEGLETNLLVGNALIDMYAKSGALLEAHVVLVKLSCRNVVSWNALIAGFVEHEHGFEALCFFKSMQAEGITPDDATLSCALKACGVTGKMQEGQEIHSELVRRGLAMNTLVGNGIVSFYAKCGLLDRAHEVFETLQVHDMVSWTTLIMGYAEYERFEEALCCYYWMQYKGVSSDMTTFLCTLKACSGLAALDTGQGIHAEIVGKRNKLDPMMGSSLVGMYAQCGSLERAQDVFNKLLFHNTPMYNALLTGYAQVGDTEKVFCNICLMIKEGLPLNVATIASVLNACSYSGLVDEAQVCLKSMSKNFSITPTVVHYNCIVDLLCRAGSVEFAVALIEVMPFQPSAVVWHGVLGACQWCNNVELGMLAFNQALGLNEKDSSVYIGMLNIFSMEK